MLVPAHDVRSTNERHEIGAEELGFVETTNVERPSDTGLVSTSGALADDLPLGRRGHGDRVAALDVRLIEARKQSMGFVRLEVRVDVLLAVLRIDEAMEAVTGGVVVVLVDDADGVVMRRAANPEASADSHSTRARGLHR